MRPKLLKSFFLVTLFWFCATTVYWGLVEPARNHEALVALKSLAPALPFEVPARTTVLNAWRTQLLVLAWWTVPVWALTLVSGLLGSGLVWLATYRRHRERESREAGHGEFRGLSLTLGVLPLPPGLPRDELDLGADDSGALDKLTEKEKRLLNHVLGTLSAAPEAYPGEGIEGSLLDNALMMASRALNNRRHPGLSAIVAAAHEMGKITAWARDATGEWARVKDQGREAARILATLDAWWELPSDDRNAVLLAVKYHSDPRSMPSLDTDQRVYRHARDLLDVASEAQEEVLAEEKQKTLEKHELPELIFDAFLQNLPLLAFQNRGLPMGVRAVAWKHGNRVYLLEIELRERSLARLDATVRGALVPNSRERSRVQPFTLELLKALDAHGWLVREIGQMKLAATEALWVVKAGKLEFRGVIIIDVPPEHLETLPAQDSIYQVSVLAPLFQQPGRAPVAKSDLGGILAPKSESRGETAPASPAAPGAAPLEATTAGAPPESA